LFAFIPRFVQVGTGYDRPRHIEGRKEYVMKILVITDNIYLYNSFKKITGAPVYSDMEFHFMSTDSKISVSGEIPVINVKTEYKEKIIGFFDLVISMHCRQLFPAELAGSVRCINVHPGLNPYNRGWFPQVFSIINKLPAGATIHEIDAEIDHGAVIVQQAVEVYPSDTSLDVYNRVLEEELKLLERHLYDIVMKKYTSVPMEEEGNLNLLRDFRQLCKIDLNENMTVGKTIDLLRALTHHPYKNAYFVDENTGKKIYVGLSLHPEDPE